MGLWGKIGKVLEEGLMNEILGHVKASGTARGGVLSVPCVVAVEMHSGIWVGPLEGQEGTHLAVYACRAELFVDKIEKSLLREMITDPRQGAMALTMHRINNMETSPLNLGSTRVGAEGLAKQLARMAADKNR